MDQFVSALGKQGHALLIDCCSLDYQHVPLPDSESEKPGMRIVVSNSGVSRGLSSSAYNERRSQCEQAVELLQPYLSGVTALRDVTVEDFESHADRLPELIRRRARHIVTENTRTLQAVEALKNDDLDRFGELMKSSHQSLRHDYEVSCAELDTLVEAAWTVAGCHGSRLTGAGFGGCTVSFVDDDAVESFQKTVGQAYQQAHGRTPEIYVCTAEDGVKTL
jgi:galactokinase